MDTTILTLPDGTQLRAGNQEQNAVKSLRFTQCVNNGTELTLGSVCTNMVEIQLITPQGELSIEEGQQIRVDRVSEDGTRFSLGLFTTQKPERTGTNSLKITAYDQVAQLEKDLTQWLSELNQWPYRLSQLAQMVCQACGVELVDTQIPNGEYSVRKFTAQGITGRKLMQWVGELAGRFLRATPEGKLEFAWYQVNDRLQIYPTDLQILASDGQLQLRHPGAQLTRQAPGDLALTAPNILVEHDGAGHVQITVPTENVAVYRGGSLTYQDYQVAPIQRVQLKNSAQDVGTLWPADLTQSANTYVVSDNYLLSASGADDLKPIAQTLYEQLSSVTYTPCQLKLPADARVQAGDILTVIDGNGVRLTVYVMKRVLSGQVDSITCTGSANRQNLEVFHSFSAQSLAGKVTELRLNVDGLRLENRDTAGNVAKLSAQIGGIQAEVSSQKENIIGMQQNLTQLRQDAKQIQLSVQTVQTQGAHKVQTQTGYTFDQRGLTIRKDDTGMENLLDDTGMYVRRSGQVVLQANDAGVEAVDVTVRNYLIVGEHARLEDYSSGADQKRTACFWI